MGNRVTINRYDGDTEVFDNVLGHQVGNGAIQILLENGNNRIIFDPHSVDIELDEETSKEFAAKLEKAQAADAAKVANSATEKVPLKVVDQVKPE